MMEWAEVDMTDRQAKIAFLLKLAVNSTEQRRDRNRTGFAWQNRIAATLGLWEIDFTFLSCLCFVSFALLFFLPTRRFVICHFADLRSLGVCHVVRTCIECFGCRTLFLRIALVS